MRKTIKTEEELRNDCKEEYLKDFDFSLCGKELTERQTNSLNLFGCTTVIKAGVKYWIYPSMVKFILTYKINAYV